MNSLLKEKTVLLKKLLIGYRNLLIAYSGGVDSSLLTAAAARFLPGKYLAVTIITPFHSIKDIEDARNLALNSAFNYREICIDRMDIAKIWNNHPDRCYFCKKELFTRLCELAKKEGYPVIADGSILDDDEVRRPGKEALKELGIKSPLKEAGFTKNDIRLLAKEWGLSNYHQPARPCLLSRFPYYTDMTDALLRQVEAGEMILYSLGFSDFRLRHHGNLCRIELPKKEWPSFFVQADTIAIALKKLGYIHIVLDLDGLKSGGFDNNLSKEE